MSAADATETTESTDTRTYGQEPSQDSPRGLTETTTLRDPRELKPYPANPREITQEAVEKVAESIQMFGWQQPIVVDPHDVVVVGHTRLRAALHLGLSQVPVHTMHGTEEEIREYRLVDNRTGEMSEWDYKSLGIELREMDDDIVDTYFPDVDMEISTVEGARREPSEGEIARATQEAQTIKPPSEGMTHTTEVVCPKCYQDFQVRTTSLPGVDDALIRELTHGEEE